MINEEKYENLIIEMLDKRNEGYLKKNDFIVMMYLLIVIDENRCIYIKQRRIANATGLTKSEVSKSLKRLIEAEILIRENNECEEGYKINI